MRYFAAKPTEEELPRIVTVDIGRMVVRQVRRACAMPSASIREGREEVIHDFPALGQIMKL